MIVKICGITNLEDAQAAIEAGAAALGFNFWPGSPRYIAPERAAQILAALPPGVWKAGIFVNSPAESIAQTAAHLGLDVAQLYGTAAAPAGIRIWRAVRVEPGFDPGRLEDPAAEAFVLDAAPPSLWGGAGLCFDWRLARGATRRIIVAGGLDENNVREAIRQARPWGVDACSRLERAPGRKDHARLRRFVREALAEAAFEGGES